MFSSFFVQVLFCFCSSLFCRFIHFLRLAAGSLYTVFSMRILKHFGKDKDKTSNNMKNIHDFYKKYFIFKILIKFYFKLLKTQ